jgi:lysophospholipase L1-like esterase
MMKRLLIAALGVAWTASAEPAAAETRLVSNLAAGKTQTIVTYGTSLTEQGGWVNQLRAALDKAYPGLATVINSGRSGQWSQWGVSNLEERVIAKKPDVVFLEFAVNDAVARFGCTVGLARTNLENMVGRILKANPDCEIVLMTMTPADKYPQGHFSHRENIAAYYQMYRDVAKSRTLLLVDNDVNWTALKAKDPGLFQKYVPDTIHPLPEACAAVVTPEIRRTLGLP